MTVFSVSVREEYSAFIYTYIYIGTLLKTNSYLNIKNIEYENR